MTRSRLILCCLASALSLSACYRRAEDPAAVTPDEQSQLNDAAATLDANVVIANDVDTDADGNTEDPS
ncbi:hypothetical protein [uncultured Sphingomonas sp.]|uniref:hypothetical protein n=1 Tax=uncultured Sphingomonas sp. TaxID=158754 RepID=UPI0035CBD57A